MQTENNITWENKSAQNNNPLTKRSAQITVRH